MAKEKLDFMFSEPTDERGRLEYVNLLTGMIDEFKANVHRTLSHAEWREYVAHQHDKDNEAIRKEDLKLIKKKHDRKDNA